MVASTVQKSEIRIAHPVSLRVTPLTIADALAMGLQLPSVESDINISDNTSEIRQRIPIRARRKWKLYIHYHIMPGVFMPCKKMVQISLMSDWIQLETTTHQML